MQIHLKQHHFMTLEEFARVIMSIKPVLNNPDAFNKWMKNEEVKFEESLSYYVGLITVYVTLYYFPPPGKAIFLFIYLYRYPNTFLTAQY